MSPVGTIILICVLAASSFLNGWVWSNRWRKSKRRAKR